jgi:hypothetical protein
MTKRRRSNNNSQFTSFIVLTIITLQTTVNCLSSSQLQALTDLYYATNGAYWFNNNGWPVGDPCENADWYGVSCADDGGVWEVSSLLVIYYVIMLLKREMHTAMITN